MLNKQKNRLHRIIFSILTIVLAGCTLGLSACGGFITANEEYCVRLHEHTMDEEAMRCSETVTVEGEDAEAFVSLIYNTEDNTKVEAGKERSVRMENVTFTKPLPIHSRKYHIDVTYPIKGESKDAPSVRAEFFITEDGEVFERVFVPNTQEMEDAKIHLGVIWARIDDEALAKAILQFYQNHCYK